MTRGTIVAAMPLWGLFAILGSAVTGCGRNPTQPSVLSPVITSIAPSPLIRNGTDQGVTVSGQNFEDGLTVIVGLPDASTTTLSGARIQRVSATSFEAVAILANVGSHTLRVINPSGQASNTFSFTVQSQVASGQQPMSVLSPVLGALTVTSSNIHVADGRWEFNQHKGSLHRPGGGISGSDDTYAWDVNLYTPTNANADAGQEVRAVADGEVVDYAGVAPGQSAGAVLIAHPSSQNPVWWSGYLHMQSLSISSGQRVTHDSIIGRIGRAGIDNDHLHFVVYTGICAFHAS
jgi:hypothetical protein